MQTGGHAIFLQHIRHLFLKFFVACVMVILEVALPKSALPIMEVHVANNCKDELKMKALLYCTLSEFLQTCRLEKKHTLKGKAPSVIG